MIIFHRFIDKLGYISFMQNIEFIKMHGLGNDFVIIDKRSKDIPVTEDLIRKLSDRRTGAGCDQLITITNSKNEADVKMQERMRREMLLQSSRKPFVSYHEIFFFF